LKRFLSNVVSHTFLGPSKEELLKKKERREERRIMRLLVQKKVWNKIANQIKFKNFIRLIIKKSRKDPNFICKKFKIFRFIDKLHKARIERMIAIKKIMAR